MNSRTKPMNRHPLSAAFPDMPAADFAELVDDIRANGLIQPVVTFEGMVLDGWHRYRASLEAGVDPFFEEFAGNDPVAYAISLNMHRRHLSGSQRAAAVVACHAWAPAHRPEKEAPGAPLTNEQMAGEAGVGETTIKQAKRAHEAGLGEAVRDGKVTAKEAAAVAKLPEPERKAALEAPKPKPEPAKPEPSGNPGELEALKARVAELESENEELRDHVRQMLEYTDSTKEELESMRRILDAEGLFEQFQKEVKRAQEQSRILTARNNGLINEVNELKGFCKMWKGKFERLEKATKKSQEEADEMAS